MSRKPIQTDRAPAAIGPYSQAIVHGNTVYVSGQIPLDPVTGEVVEGDISRLARQVLDNLSAVAEAAGTDLSRALKITVFLTDMGDFSAINEVFADYLSRPYPARAAVEVAGLPRGVAVEMDAVLALPDQE